MPPILVTATGPPLHERDAIRQVRQSFPTIDANHVVSFLDNAVRSIEWKLDDLVDLYHWKDQLNAMDRFYESVIDQYRIQLLPRATCSNDDDDDTINNSSNNNKPDLPITIVQQLHVLLEFTVSLLSHSINKHIYNSCSHLEAFLEHTHLVDITLDVLSTLHVPIPVYRTFNNVNAQTINTESSLHDKLLILARGWGSHTTGSGLADICFADDHTVLPNHGTVHFPYYQTTNGNTTTLTTIHIPPSQLLACDNSNDNTNSNQSVAKRPKLAGSSTTTTLSTPQRLQDRIYSIFCQHYTKVPPTKAFELLCEISLAVSYHRHECRLRAVLRRLRALWTLLYSNVSSELMSGYFQAQPELSVELVQLIQPIVADVGVLTKNNTPDGGVSLTGSQPDLATGGSVVYTIQLLALDVLTALVSRRDSLTPATRLSTTVLSELGVVKGHYLGLLPTLIRYSLGKSTTLNIAASNPSDAAGLAFVQAVLPQQPNPQARIVFVDKVLTLTSAVVGSPSGTSALVDCGLVPAVLSTIKEEPNELIVAQAIQILEGSIVTHNHAITALTDLKGVDVLIQRLADEIHDSDGDAQLVVTNAQRVLLFSILSCLTVILHQETTHSGGAYLQRPELQTCIVEFFRNRGYGGHIGALVATMLSDIMNSDPQIVRHVHESGMAAAFMDHVNAGGLPPVPELIMAVPNVLFALALNEEGANAVVEANPFPALLSILHDREYAMPNSRCLLNEIPSAVGTGLDDVMRNVNSLKPLILKSVADALMQVVDFGHSLREREQQGPHTAELENDRSCLIQFLLNYGQLLEQVLQKPDHCESFAQFGGVDALLSLFSISIPRGSQFLFFASTLSCTSVSSLHHATTEEVLYGAAKYLEFRDKPQVLFQKLVQRAHTQLDKHAELEQKLQGSQSHFSLDAVPLETVSTAANGNLALLADYLESAANLQWITRLLANAVRASSHRRGVSAWSRTDRVWLRELSAHNFVQLAERLSQFHRSSVFEVCRARSNADFERRERERYQKRSQNLRYRLRIVCPEGAVIRDGIEIDSCAHVGNLEMGDIVVAFDRCINSSGILRYRTERGWVSEMTRGHGREPIAEVIQVWMSDEPVAPTTTKSDERDRVETGLQDIRTVAVGVLARGQGSYGDLFSALSKVVVEGVRALPSSSPFGETSEHGSRVSKIMMLVSSNFRSAFDQPGVRNVVFRELANTAGGMGQNEIGGAGSALYLGSILNVLQSCLFEDKRERRTVNLPLLLSLVLFDPFYTQRDDGESRAVPSNSRVGLFDALRYIFKFALSEFAANEHEDSTADGVYYQRVSRSTAASLPPLISFLRKVVGTPISNSPTATIMSRMSPKDISAFLGEELTDFPMQPKGDGFFQPEAFVASLQLCISWVSQDFWGDRRLSFMPPFLLQPFIVFLSELFAALEDLSEKKTSSSNGRSADRLRLSELVRRRLSNGNEPENEDFEPSEEIVAQLIEMGFTREHALHALESTRSNSIEIAAGYAVSYGPPSAATIERSRAAREARAQQRAAREQANQERSQQAAETGNDGLETEDETNQANENDDAMDAEESPAAVNPPSESAAQDSDKSTKEAETHSRDSLARAEITLWTEDIPKISCALLSNMPGASERRLRRAIGRGKTSHAKTIDGDGESEALTIVLSSFMIESCKKKPEKRSDILSRVLDCLQDCVRVDSEGGVYVAEDKEAMFACLCHSAAIIMRAFHSTRLLVLKKGLVGTLLSCIKHNSGQSHGEDGTFRLPQWIAPAFLLLETMAQPLTAFSDKEFVASIVADSPNGEFVEVQKEHEQQVAELKHLMNQCYGSNRLEPSNTEPESNMNSADSKKTSPTEMDVDQDDAKGSTLSVPAYFPLLPASCVDSCVEVCKHVLDFCSRSDQVSPGIVQSTLTLLLRLLRSPRVAAKSAGLGIVDSVLALPKGCRFAGNAGLVTLLLRRFLEDEFVLQSAMETEIRATIARLHAKKGSQVAKSKPSVSLSSFMEISTPLLCRHPPTFLKAVAACVSFKGNPDASIPRGRPRSGAETMITLRSQKKGETPQTLQSSGPSATSDPKDDSSPVKGKTKGPQKSSRRGSSSKKRKKDKGDPSGTSSRRSSSEFQVVHVTHQLISEFIYCASRESSTGEQQKFLASSDLLEILADLVLAVPTCATAVNNTRSHKKDKSKRCPDLPHFNHAMSNSPTPPRTFIAFILHSVLPTDRWSIKKDAEIWGANKSASKDELAAVKEKKKKAVTLVNTTQAAARLLMALVYRNCESRKRVIAELAFALSAGNFGHGADGSKAMVTDESAPLSGHEMSALHAWGELCLGITTPRSSGRNVESTSSLSFENIKLMLEYGVGHALFYAVDRVGLSHPMASGTCGLLLMPLEILTKGHIYDVVKGIVGKENTLAGSPEKAESSIRQLGDSMDVSIEHDIPADDSAEYMVDGEDEVGSSNDEIDDSSSEGADESTDEESDEETEDEEVDDDDRSLVDEEESSDEVSQDRDWSINYDDPGDEAESQNIEDYDDAAEQAALNLDEGWTQIDSTNNSFSTGFGEMNVRRGGGTAGAAPSRSRVFMDAAEAMIGSLLRNGDINTDELAEIEGTLGIRIMPAGRAVRATLNRDGGGGAVLESVLAGRAPAANSGERLPTDSIVVTPIISQRSQPDLGFSSYGSSQLHEVNPMEFVFGGPSLTGGSGNYDVVTTLPDEEEDSMVLPNQLDLQLFPGGPAAAIRGRQQNTQHPLLTGVDLPPVNAMVSDLLPHGVRSRRRATPVSRRVGDFMSPFAGASDSLGTFGRSNAGGVGALGWTDDGLPVDGAVVEFSSAISNNIDRTVTTPSPAQSRNARSEDSPAVPGADAPEQDPEDGSTEQENLPLANRDTAEVGAEETTAQQAINEEQDAVAPSDGQDTVVPVDLPSFPSRGDDGAEDSTEAGDAHEREGGNNPSPSAVNLSNASEEVPDDEMAEESSAMAVDSPTNDGNGPHASGEESNPSNGQEQLTCPPDFDVDVFNSLPREMQQEVVTQYAATQELAAQLDGSSLDPAVLAELPEDMRREVLEQERQERRRREQDQAPANPANAQDMDNASIIASMAPELREDILLTLDEAALAALPPDIQAEAHILRERASVQQRRIYDSSLTGAGVSDRQNASGQRQASAQAASSGNNADASPTAARRRQRNGKLKVDIDRDEIVYRPAELPSPVSVADLQAMIRLLYLLTPVRPQKLLQRVLLNLCGQPKLRSILIGTFVALLHEDADSARRFVESWKEAYQTDDQWRCALDGMFATHDFPPTELIGAVPETSGSNSQNKTGSSLLRRRHGEGIYSSMAANLPKRASDQGTSYVLPPVVGSRILETLSAFCKNSRLCLHVLVSPVSALGSDEQPSCFEKLLELLDKPMYKKSSGNLEQLLGLLELAVSPLSHLAKNHGDELDISQSEIVAAKASGKEYADVPRISISQSRLQVLCAILRMESCRDTSFTKVNTIVRRLCRVDSNRGYVLTELATVAHALGTDARNDLRALRARMENAVAQYQQRQSEMEVEGQKNGVLGAISSSVTLSTSSSELKLLRVLQTLQALCNDSGDDSLSRKHEGTVVVTEVLVDLLRQMQFDDLWNQLSECLKIVQVLEGVESWEEDAKATDESGNGNDEESADETAEKTKKLRNSAAGLLTRFLPSVEAFFVANASATRISAKAKEKENSDSNGLALENMVGGDRMMEFVKTNKVLLNALVRNNPSLLEKGLRALILVPCFRPLLDFDVKRQWFKTQVRRLRQQASRRYGSLRLHISRENVFQEAYYQLQPRNADEMRGRLHVTFRNEEGVDAGGLSREFFNILAKEMFNPNYALFTSTEDGCTFQPNPNSMINPDHLSYFRFVGRVVGKAVADGYLLDAHFTRSLYKHMLGVEPTHHDMEAIDPDYYGNLRTILECNLVDMGLDDMTFMIEDHSFGRSQVIDLMPNGRTIKVTEENKEQYVRKICQHRMTTAIKSQIKSYLDGFYELVSPELIAIFTPRELELLISGLPEIDIQDLKDNTDYVGWRGSDKEIGWFWNILFSLSRNEKASFLQFVTGSSKVPLAGFAELQGMRGTQKFSIHKASRANALMSAHTCFNSLDLPNYDNEEEMRKKLLLAINEGGGAFTFA